MQLTVFIPYVDWMGYTCPHTSPPFCSIHLRRRIPVLFIENCRQLFTTLFWRCICFVT